jgi:hypothetical protein
MLFSQISYPRQKNLHFSSSLYNLNLVHLENRNFLSTLRDYFVTSIETHLNQSETLGFNMDQVSQGISQSFHSPRGGTGVRKGVRVSSSSLLTSPRNH